MQLLHRWWIYINEISLPFSRTALCILLYAGNLFLFQTFLNQHPLILTPDILPGVTTLVLMFLYYRIQDEFPPLVPVSPAVAAALLGTETGRPLELGPPRALPEVKVTVEVRANERAFASRNVLGVIPGSDPTLRDEVVLLGAHVDHLGRVGGAIHPGADDNASGVAALLEIARVFAAAGSAPKRTVAFAFWTGEEEGKLGSGHYVRHPFWPLAKTTYLNLDMLAYPWLAEDIRDVVKASGLEDPDAFLAGFDTVDYVEPGLPEGLPDLDAALRRAARGTGVVLHLDRTDGRNGGSDYRDFARAGL